MTRYFVTAFLVLTVVVYIIVLIVVVFKEVNNVKKILEKNIEKMRLVSKLCSLSVHLAVQRLWFSVTTVSVGRFFWFIFCWICASLYYPQCSAAYFTLAIKNTL